MHRPSHLCTRRFGDARLHSGNPFLKHMTTYIEHQPSTNCKKGRRRSDRRVKPYVAVHLKLAGARDVVGVAVGVDSELECQPQVSNDGKISVYLSIESPHKI